MKILKKFFACGSIVCEMILTDDDTVFTKTKTPSSVSATTLREFLFD